MTADTTTVMADFIAALTDQARDALHPTRNIEYHLHVATEQHGWTVQQLAAECSRDLDTAGNVGAVITERLRIATTVGPPSKSKAAISKGHAFCSPECADNRGLLLDPNTLLPTGKCPCRTKETTD